VTLRPPRAPVGSYPVDFGKLRLWVPSNWRLEDRLGYPCSTGPQVDFERVVLSTGVPQLTCRAARKGAWVWVRQPAPAVPAGAKLTSLSGLLVRVSPAEPPGAVRYDVPGYDESVTAYGPGSRAVASTLGPSALGAVLAARQPVRVPKGWRRVSLDGTSARVPPNWPVGAYPRQLIGIGTCGLPFPQPPRAYIGGQDITSANCPAEDGSLAATPDDGLWLVAGANDFFHLLKSGGGGHRAWSVPGAKVTLVYASAAALGQGVDLVWALVQAHGRPVLATVGLGTEPSIAEEILGSLGASSSA
jgi:hypothetical protein